MTFPPEVMLVVYRWADNTPIKQTGWEEMIDILFSKGEECIWQRSRYEGGPCDIINAEV